MTNSLAISLLLSVSVLSVGCSGDLDHSAESAGAEQEPPRLPSQTLAVLK